ncbi:STAS domain-containing protein [Streptomyces sp. NPDC002328]|uniref:STAS domain-containing protein n=1 Tax=Streptomyces sp. NPDC002328 TaxID=3364642 RepID=UPI003695CB70
MLDLAGLEFCDSSGVSALIAARYLAGAAEADIVLAAVLPTPCAFCASSASTDLLLQPRQRRRYPALTGEAASGAPHGVCGGHPGTRENRAAKSTEER